MNTALEMRIRFALAAGKMLRAFDDSRVEILEPLLRYSMSLIWWRIHLEVAMESTKLQLTYKVPPCA